MRFIIAFYLGRLGFTSTTRLGRDSQFLILPLAAILFQMKPADSACCRTAVERYLPLLGTLVFPL